MSWFSKGEQAVQQQVQMQEERRKNRAPKRVWLPEMASKEVIYLDEEGFNFYEHSVQNGEIWEQFTCLGANNGCPICASGNRPYQITVFTVIDLSRWVDKKGETHVNEKLIHALKAQPAYSLLEKKKRWDGLAGKKVIISRKGPKDSSAGSDFEPAMSAGKIVKYKLDPTNKEEHRPYDYVTIYAPKTPDYIRQALGYTTPSSTSFKASSPTSGRTAGQGSGAFQTLPEGLEIEQVDPNDIPSSINEDQVPF